MIECKVIRLFVNKEWLKNKFLILSESSDRKRFFDTQPNVGPIKIRMHTGLRRVFLIGPPMRPCIGKYRIGLAHQLKSGSYSLTIPYLAKYKLSI